MLIYGDIKLSIKYLNQAFQCSNFIAMEKLLMIALCDTVNDDGFGYPGYKKLMRKTSMAKATLSKHLSILKDAKIFDVKPHGEIGEGRKVNTYQIHEFWNFPELQKTLKDSRERHKTSRKVQGVNLSQNTRKVQGVKSSRVEPRKVQGLNPISSRVEHEPSVLTISKEPSVLKDGYAFCGQVIKINKKGFDEMAELYSNLDLMAELKQLDFELRESKGSWYMTMNKKLNYRNKQSGTNNGNQHNQKRETVGEKANRLSRELGQQAMAADDFDLSNKLRLT